ncbi:MAG: alpha-L-rhamnosidase N-terminal domain-containing protein [Chloroflexota bacterium]
MTVFETAVWTGSAHPFDLHEVYLDFRSPVIMGRQGERVELCISADSRYKMWLNGRFITRGPSRSYPHAQAYDRLDLTDQWQAGENVLAVQVYQPGYSHFSYVHRAAAGLLAILCIDGEVALVSDSRWRVRRNLSFASEVPRVSIYGSGVEIRNWEQVDAWQQVNYDATEWDSARVVAAAEGAIWSGLTEQETPQLVERLADLRLVESRVGMGGFFLEEPHWELRETWQNGQQTEFATDAEGWIRPFLDFDITALWLFDLGRAYTCQGGVEVHGASGGEHISISYADKTADNELIISDPSTYCRVQLTDSFALRTGNQLIEPFSMRGGRYVLFQLAGELGNNFAFRPHVRVAEYPLTITKPLQTEDKLLNQIIEMCETTMRACLQDSFVDCVWRESSQWLGDGLLQSMTLAAMCDDKRPLRKLLLDTAHGQDKLGLVPSIAPGEVHAYTIPRYACMWVELLAFYYDTNGDDAFVFGTDAQPSLVWHCLQRLLAYFDRNVRSDGLRVTENGRRHYIDWSPTSQNDPHAVYNLHIVLALQKAADLAAQIAPEQAQVWCDKAATLRAQCRRAFYQDDKWYDDLERTTFSQLAAAMALLVGAVEPDEKEDLLNMIIGRSLDPSDEPKAGEIVLASPFMHHYLFEALRENGRYQAIIDIVRLRWGRWVQQRYPTTWENWNVDFPDGSQCHAFSAHPRYHLQKASQHVSLSARKLKN